MERSSDDWGWLRDLLKIYAGVAVAVYAWLAFFVLLLRYDYVTTSSILFALFFALVLIGAFPSIIELVKERSAWGGVFFAIGFLLTLGALTAGLGIFVAIHDPYISKRFDIVAKFWGALGWPFVITFNAIASLVPPVGAFAMRCLNWANSNPIASNTISALLATALTAPFLRRRLSERTAA